MLSSRPTLGGVRGVAWALGSFHLVTGLWLMYLVWAATLGASVGIKLPL
jgi:hypothetical protein